MCQCLKRLMCKCYASKLKTRENMAARRSKSVELSKMEYHTVIKLIHLKGMKDNQLREKNNNVLLI